MASGLPIVKQASILSILPQIVLTGLILSACYRFFPEFYYLVGFAVYMVLFFTLRTTIPSKHRKGIRLFKQKKFEEALPCFRESYAFFSKYKWLDKYRYIFMLSSSRISYREMALLNEAFCLGQMDRKAEAIEKYEYVLKLYPDSEMAISALKMLK